MNDSEMCKKQIGLLVNNNVGVIHLHQHNELNPRLYLEKPIQRRGVTRFHYRSDAISFLGRQDEMAQLNDFCNIDQDQEGDRVSVWLITGAGGIGKSRLARQLCMDLTQKGWVSGFYSRHQQGGVPENWKPLANTLIVVDYASQVKDLKERLHTWQNSSQDTWEHSVRILLLERTDNELAPLVTHNQGQGLALKSLSDQALCQLMKEVYQAVDQPLKPRMPTEQLFLDVLDQIDPDYHRPLFAAFVADAMAHCEQPTDRYALLHYISSKDQVRWATNLFPDQDELHKQYLRLLYLTTLMGGAYLDDLKSEVYPAKLIPPFETIDRKLFSEMAGQETTADYIPSLEPDIYGEWFLLNFPNPHNLQEDSYMEALHRAAWQYERSKIAYVLTRLSQDFPYHENLPGLKNKLIGSAHKQIKNNIVVKQVATLLFYSTVHEKDPAQVAAIAQEIRELYVQHPQDGAIRTQLGYALINCTAIEPDPVIRYTFAGEIREMYELGKEPILLKALVKALMNCTAVEPNSTKAAEIAAEIRQLHVFCSNESAVREALVKTLVNCTVVEQDPRKQRTIADEIRNLHKQYGEEWMVRHQLACALMNCTAFETDASKVSASVSEIRQLHEQYGYEKAIREQLANALLNLSHLTLNAIKRSILADEVRKLYWQHGKENAIRIALVRALMKCTAIGSDYTKRRAFAAEIRQLYQKEDDESTIVRHQLVKALCNCTAGESDPGSAAVLVAEIRQIYEQHNHENVVRDALIKALNNWAIIEPDSINKAALKSEIQSLHTATPVMR